MKVDLLLRNIPHLLLERAAGIGQDAEDARYESAQGPLEDSIGERRLGAEVVVDQGLVDPRLVGDLLGPAVGGAFSEEDGMGRIENPFSGLDVSV